MLAAFYLLLCYLLGSIPTGVIVATMSSDVDVRTLGSGNIGATNVTRVLGRSHGALTLGGDLVKGFVAVGAAHWVSPSLAYVALATFAVFGGHCWSAYLGFRGGKGVATSAGAMLAIAPLATFLAATAWMLVFMYGGHKASKASLAAAAALPILLALTQPDAVWIALALGLGIALRHRENIHRLRSGEGA
jgi:glycerol-3-phosphate acyltransferase PlsY